MPLESKYGYDFGSQTPYLQQYNPNGTSNYPIYHVKNLITAGGRVGTIELPNLDGTYGSQEPYAYFENAKSIFKRLKSKKDFSILG